MDVSWECACAGTPSELDAAPAARVHTTFRTGAQFTNDPMTRAMLCAISLSSGNDSMPITE